MNKKISLKTNQKDEESIILSIKKTGKLPTRGNVMSKIKKDTNWNGVRKRLHDRYGFWVHPSQNFIKYERGKWLYKIPKESIETQKTRSTITEWQWVEGPELKDKDWYKSAMAQKRSIRPSSYSESVLPNEPSGGGKKVIKTSSYSKSATKATEDVAEISKEELAKQVKSRPSKKRTFKHVR